MIFLPLGELSRILTIAVQANSEVKTAEGFIVTEDRQFLLDVSQSTVAIGVQKTNFDPNLIRIQENEIFIESTLYQKWFPVELSFDIPGLMLTVTAKENLPIQSKIDRSKKTISENETSHLQFMNFDTPYSILDKPFVDQTLQLNSNKKSNSQVQSSLQYTTLLSGDFLGLKTHFIANGSDQKNLENYRFSMGRDDPEGNLLGIANARTFSFGNVNLPSLNYVNRPTSLGRGGFISNKPLSRPSRYDSQSFTGDLLPGWDVELFQNGVLIGYQTSNDRAQYEFNDLPLYFGGNDFRLIFHGPTGQMREERYRFMLEDSMVLPGETYYSLGAVQFEDGRKRTLMQIDQSLLTQLSTTFGIVANDVSSVSNDINTTGAYRPNLSYYNLGLRSYLDSVFLSADGILTSDEGSLGSLSLKTGFWNSSFSISHAVLENFISEDFLPSDDLENERSKARFDTFVFKMPFSLEGTRSHLTSGQVNYDVSAKVSAYIKSISITHRLKYLHSPGLNSTSGELQVSSRVGRFQIRGGLTYEIEPISRTTSIDLNGNIRLNREFNFTQSISSQMQSNESRLELGINKEIGEYGLGITTGGTNLGEQFVGFRLNIGIGVEPRRSKLYTSAQSMATTGAVSALAFLDHNLNGQWDADEDLLPGVGFRVDGGMSPIRTEDDGVALLTHLPTGQRINIGIDRNTIDDPQVSPFIKGVRLLPRPGKIAEVNFPFIRTTEIDGIISIDNGVETKPASDIQLELVEFSDKEQVVRETSTAFDGYYILDEVPPGKYILRIESEQAARLNIAVPDLKVLRILPHSNFINGLDFILKRYSQKADDVIENQPLLISPELNTEMEDLYFVILGSFALERSFEPLTTKLVQLKIPYVVNQFSRPLKVFRIQTEFETEALAQVFMETLTTYEYSFGKQEDVGKIKIFIGPYYSENELQKEKSVITAAFPNVKMKMTSNVESLDMNEIAVGGFNSQKEATDFASVIKKYNFNDITIQKRPNKQWKSP